MQKPALGQIVPTSPNQSSTPTIFEENYLKRKQSSPESVAKKICKIDDGEKPYKCNICTKEFASKIDLNCHEKINHKENPKAYKCDKCEKDFINLLGLNAHKRKHLKERSCKYCKKSFDKKDALDAHILKNHFDDVFKNKCTVCGLFQYSTSKKNLNSNVNRHMSMHSQPTYTHSHTSKRRQPPTTLEPIKESTENKYRLIRYLIN